MNCPKCSAPAEEKPGARCSSCGYEFVFDREADGVVDDEWLELLQRASENESHWFTENQLYAAYAANHTRVARYIGRRGFWGLLSIPVGTAVWVHGLRVDSGLTLVLGILLILGGVALVGMGVVTRREPPPRELVARWVLRWLAAGRGIEKLIQTHTLDAHPALPAKHVLIVERDSLVELLYKNGICETHELLVLSELGHPAGSWAQARRMLADRAELPVFLLHDTGLHGANLGARLLENRELELGPRRLLDVGLFPADVAQIIPLARITSEAGHGNVPLDYLTLPQIAAGIRGVLAGATLFSTGVIDSASDV
jgi:hypothetical protein